MANIFTKWFCIILIVFSTTVKYVKRFAYFVPRLLPHKIAFNFYSPQDLQIEDEHISFHIQNYSSSTVYTGYTYTLIDRELIISLYGRLSEPKIINKVFPKYIIDVVISIHADLYDRVLLSDGQKTKLIYEKERYVYENITDPDAPVPEFIGTYN